MAIRRSQHNVYDYIVYMSTNHSCRRVKHLTRLKFEIVAGRDDFAERGSVSRSTMKATDALDLSMRLAAGKAPADHRPALLWLRLRRAELDRRAALWAALGKADAWGHSDRLPKTIRRFG